MAFFAEEQTQYAQEGCAFRHEPYQGVQHSEEYAPWSEVAYAPVQEQWQATEEPPAQYYPAQEECYWQPREATPPHHAYGQDPYTTTTTTTTTTTVRPHVQPQPQTITLVPTAPPTRPRPVVVTEYVLVQPGQGGQERVVRTFSSQPQQVQPQMQPTLVKLLPSQHQHMRQPQPQHQHRRQHVVQPTQGQQLYFEDSEGLTDGGDHSHSTPPPTPPPSQAQRRTSGSDSSSATQAALPTVGPSLTHFEISVQFKHGRVGEFVYPQAVPQGTHCIVEGDRGQDLGLVVESKEVAYRREDLRRRLKIKRFATEEEVRRWRVVLVQEEMKSVEFMRQQADKHGIPINLHAAEFQFDRKKLTFHYSTREGCHPDFRTLLRNGYKQFRCRIWMNNCKPQNGEPGDALQVPPAPELPMMRINEEATLPVAMTAAGVRS